MNTEDSKNAILGNYDLPLSHTKETSLTAQQKLEISLELSGVATWYHDYVAKELYWSDLMFKLLGVKRISPMTVDYAFEVLNDEAIQVIENAASQITPYPDPSGFSSYQTSELLLQHTTGQGEHRMLVNQWKSLFNGDGQEVLRIGYVRDETDLILARQKLEKQALTDSLTGIANRRAYQIRLPEEVANAKRGQQMLSCLMIDVDCFKLYNDHYGHDQGDVVLQRIAQVLAKALPRKTDFVARYGGEEFVVLLPSTDVEGSRHVAHSIQTGIQSCAIPHAFSSVTERVTVSIGINSMSPQSLEADALVKQADNAMYQAKMNGRNQVVVS